MNKVKTWQPYFLLSAFLVLSFPQFALSKTIEPFAQLNDSDFGNPAISKKLRSLEHILDPVGPRGKYISVQMANGQDCHFDSSIDNWSRPDADPCSLALQIYYSANKSAQYFKSLGYQLPEPVLIIIQDNATSAVATAGGGTINFRTIPTENISLWLEPIIDIVFHEMAHIAQSSSGQIDKLANSKLGKTFVEGNANLFAYLQSGRTDLGVRDGRPGMQVLTDKYFGRITPGRYDAAEPFTSVLVELTQEMIDQASTSVDMVLKFASQNYMDAFFKMNEKSNYQDYFKEIRARLASAPQQLKSKNLIQFLNDRLRKRGLDIDSTQTDGQTSGFLIQGYPLEHLSTYLREILSSHGDTTEVTLQAGMQTDLNIHWPLKGFLFSFSDLQNLGPCITQKFGELPVAQQSSPNAVNVATIACLEDLSKTPFLTTGLTVMQRMIEFPSSGLSYNVSPKRTNEPCPQQFSVAWAWVFGADGNKVAELSIPLKCR